MPEKDENKRPPGRPKERLVIEDADEALDRLLRKEPPQEPEKGKPEGKD